MLRRPKRSKIEVVSPKEEEEEEGKVCTEIWQGDLNERNYLEKLDVDERVELNCIFKMWNKGAWIEFMCLRIRTDGGHQWLQ